MLSSKGHLNHGMSFDEAKSAATSVVAVILCSAQTTKFQNVSIQDATAVQNTEPQFVFLL